MTIGDYVKEKLSKWGVEYSDALIEVELVKTGLSSSDNVSQETNTDEFFYNLIPDIYLHFDSVSEGGYSESNDRNKMLSYYQMLAKKLGKRDFLASNTITDISNQW